MFKIRHESKDEPEESMNVSERIRCSAVLQTDDATRTLNTAATGDEAGKPLPPEQVGRLPHRESLQFPDPASEAQAFQQAQGGSCEPPGSFASL